MSLDLGFKYNVQLSEGFEHGTDILKESDAFGENRVRLPIGGCCNCPIRNGGVRQKGRIRVFWGQNGQDLMKVCVGARKESG